MSKKKKINYSLIRFRPIKEEDTEFLYRVYASTREEELAITDWSEQQKEEFLRMQFNLQHTQYLENYQGASFDIILLDKVRIGRIYVHRMPKEIRLMDISLLAEYRSKGIGTKLLKDLIGEADEKKHLLSFHVLQNNPALRLYERLGFKNAGEVGMHFLMERKPGSGKTTDQWHDEIDHI